MTVVTKKNADTLEDAGYVDVIRKSDNPQKKRFADMFLPSFHYRDTEGKLQRRTFINGTGKESPLVINGGGTIRLYKGKHPDNHNIESLKVMLAAKPSPLPPGVIIELVDHADIATDKVKTRSLRLSIMNQIEEMADDQAMIASLARRLGIGSQIRGLTATQILDFVQERAEKDPVLVNNILEDTNKQDLFDIDSAKEEGIIEVKNGYFYFGGKLLGKTDEDVIIALREDRDVLAEIRRKLARKQSYTPAQTTKVDLSEMDLPDPNQIGAGADKEFNPGAEDVSLTTLADFLARAGKVVVDGSPLVKWVSGQGFLYGTMLLGKSREAAAEFLSKNKTVYQQLSRLVDEHS